MLLLYQGPPDSAEPQGLLHEVGNFEHSMVRAAPHRGMTGNRSLRATDGVEGLRISGTQPRCAHLLMHWAVGTLVRS